MRFATGADHAATDDIERADLESPSSSHPRSARWRGAAQVSPALASPCRTFPANSVVFQRSHSMDSIAPRVSSDASPASRRGSAVACMANFVQRASDMSRTPADSLAIKTPTAAKTPTLRGRVAHRLSDEALALVASGYESLSFEEDSHTHRRVKTVSDGGKAARARFELLSWLLVFLVGGLLALISQAMVTAELLLLPAMEQMAVFAIWGGGAEPASLVRGFGAFVGVRVALVMAAAAIVTLEPHAQGSGMPRVKSNLNGTDITGYLTLRTLFAKMVAVTLVISTSLPIGKDGPMIHIGASISSLLSHALANRHPEILQPMEQRAWVSKATPGRWGTSMSHAPVRRTLASPRSPPHLWPKSGAERRRPRIAMCGARPYSSRRCQTRRQRWSWMTSDGTTNTTPGFISAARRRSTQDP
jgi:hypothetical protein